MILRRSVMLALWALLCAGGASAQVLVPSGSTWKYEATGTDLGTAWRDTAYADGGWPDGPAVLGYGETYVTTPVPFGGNSGNKHVTTYFRHQFVRPIGSPMPTSMTARVNYDDGFVLYLNGVELARRSLPGGTILYSTTASSHESGAFETIDVSSGMGLLTPGTNTLAVEVHQTNSSSSDLILDLELEVTTGALQITRGPYLQRSTPTSVIVRWRTNSPASSRVLYGPSPGNLTSSVSHPTLRTEHEVLLTDLDPDSWYTYAVGTEDTVLVGDDAHHEIHTPPLSGTPQSTRVWILGDSGAGNASAAAVRGGYTAFTGSADTDLILMLGDNAYETGTDAQYQAGVFDMYPTYLRRTTLWPTRGNHDALYSGPNNDYYDFFTLPDSAQAGGLISGTEAYYSFDYANIHFICLDSEGTDRSLSSPMWTWLTADAQATTQDWVIAFWHHPPYSKGSHDSDDVLDSGGRLKELRERALPILEQAGVDLVFNGHSHAYERSMLINGHYEDSSLFDSTMVVDGGDGKPTGDGPYNKPAGNPGNGEGTVYTVAGSSSRTGGGTFDHPVMVYSAPTLGSVVLDVSATQIDAAFVGTAGNVIDNFTLFKGTQGGVRPDPVIGPRLALRANPVQGQALIAFTLSEPGTASLTVVDVRGARVAELARGEFPVGTHEMNWNTQDALGRPAAPGTYFGILEVNGERRTVKMTLTR